MRNNRYIWLLALGAGGCGSTSHAVAPVPTAPPPTVAPAPTAVPNPGPPASGSSATPPTSDQPALPAKLPKLGDPHQDTGIIDASAFNEALASNCGSWTFEGLVAHIAPPTQDETDLELRFFADKQPTQGERADEARLVVTRQGFLDDSILAERSSFVLRLYDKDGPLSCAGWFVEQARFEWQCARGAVQGKWVHHYCP